MPDNQGRDSFSERKVEQHTTRASENSGSQKSEQSQVNKGLDAIEKQTRDKIDAVLKNE